MKLQYLHKERAWFSPSSDNGFEIIVAGDERAPESTRLQLADWVLRRVPEVRRSAEEFLNVAVDQKSLGNSEWWLEGFEFGRSLSDPPTEFDVVFTTDEGGNWNDCRLWLVRCAFAGDENSRRIIAVAYRTEW